MEFSSAIDLIQHVIIRAHDLGASDIHLHPSTTSLLVRFRVDGALSDEFMFPMYMHSEVVARIKILAFLRIDEHLMPQDGRFSFLLPTGESVDIRVSLTPTQHGEQAVLRLLRMHTELSNLIELGITSALQAPIEVALSQRKGLILVTGPTGSGKTSTLYSLLKILNTRESSIVTIEEPIEYTLEGVTQIGVHQSGFSFAHALRSVVRQDPDIIMVGEIRDRETAELAIQAALTGHLVLSTLHTIDAPTALLRLCNMGVEPYLVASTVEVVIAQRLVRKKNDSGRIGIFEVLRLDTPLREALASRITYSKLLARTNQYNYWPLREDCTNKVAEELVAMEEVERYL